MKYIVKPDPKLVEGYCLGCSEQCQNKCKGQCGGDCSKNY
jgi:Cys-rich peptide (Clo7bot family)